nr:transposase domain-containing protein [Acetobacterium woodii]
MQNAKLNDLNSYKYLNYLFEQMPTIDRENETAPEPFLPWSDQLPDICRQSMVLTNQQK